jgi:hypothetical protein
MWWWAGTSAEGRNGCPACTERKVMLAMWRGDGTEASPPLPLCRECTEFRADTPGRTRDSPTRPPQPAEWATDDSSKWAGGKCSYCACVDGPASGEVGGIFPNGVNWESVRQWERSVFVLVC